jgi:hypothetical protein
MDLKSGIALMASALALTGLVGLVSSDANAETPRATPTTVVFRNDLPGTYVLRHVRLWVDGVLQHDGAAPFAQALPRGTHLVTVAADFQMQDALLPYVAAFSLKLRSAQRIASEPGRVVRARVVEVGGVTTPVERRAQIVWRQ